VQHRILPIILSILRIKQRRQLTKSPGPLTADRGFLATTARDQLTRAAAYSSPGGVVPGRAAVGSLYRCLVTQSPGGATLSGAPGRPAGALVVQEGVFSTDGRPTGYDPSGATARTPQLGSARPTMWQYSSRRGLRKAGWVWGPYPIELFCRVRRFNLRWVRVSSIGYGPVGPY
jgi:hypothetical protein